MARDDAFARALRLLASETGPLPPETAERLDQYVALLREWNPVLSLVSVGDAAKLASVHLPDALSLTSFIRPGGAGAPYLDIGSGGGLPAIPLALVLPAVQAVLVERSVKKAEFLRRAARVLGLANVEIIAGEFPRSVMGRSFGAITARAVERPEKVHKALVPFVLDGATFVCQRGDTERFGPEMFHVEPVRDEWTAAGLRRGALHLIRARDVPRGT